MTEELQRKLTEVFAGKDVDSLFQTYIERYAKRFKSTFPTLIFRGSREEIIICIMDCLKEGKDVYDLGYLPDPKETLHVKF